MNLMARQFMPLLDATFLTIETTETPMHVASLQIFQIPTGAPESFVRDIVTAFRSPGPLTPPFGLKLAGRPARSDNTRAGSRRRRGSANTTYAIPRFPHRVANVNSEN